MANQNGTVFSRLLNNLRRGRTGIGDDQQRKVLSNQPINPYGSIEQKQQEFLDVQSSKIAYDLYTRSIYYDTDRLAAYNDFKAMDLSPEVSAALDILTDEVCLEENTIIPLLNGEKLKIKELFDKKYKDFWVYSYDTINNKIIPAKCEEVIYKGEKEVYEIVFDDDSKVLATADHKWLLKNSGKYCETINLKNGDSIQPFYTRVSNENDRINGYEMILESGKWEYTHRIVKNHVYPNEKSVVHHVDFIKTNNHPENLKVMNYFDHQKFHASLNSDRWENNSDFREKMTEIFKQNGIRWENKEWAEKTKKSFSKSQKKRWDKMSGKDRKEFGENITGELNGMFNGGYKIEGDKNGRFLKNVEREFYFEQLLEARHNTNSFDEAAKYLNTTTTILRKCKSYKKLNLQRWEDIDFLEIGLNHNSLKKACLEYEGKNIKRAYKKVCDKNGWEKRKVTSFLNKNGYENFSSFVDAINHSVKKINYIGKRPVYDMVNVGKFNNFAISTSENSGVFTHNCTRSEKGQILEIYSNNSRIKGVLKDLFHNNLNISYNLMFWTREMLKFGDCFVKLETDRELGVFDCTALPVQEIHREEAYDGNLNSARFRWDLNNMYFEEWQVAHFRIATDGARLPYGRSILEPARKIWKQLQLAEDAMLVYRLIRAPERRVYYIEVGNTDPKDIPQYIEKMKAAVKKSSVVDPTTGQVNLKYNPLPVWKKTPIPLLDGRVITIEELAKEFKEGKENYVYSIQDESHQIVPGKVVWCGKNYTAKTLTKVWLDDDTWVLTAPEHPFVLRDGSKKRADELKEGDSLMPFYTKNEKLFKNHDSVKEYLQIYNPQSGKYEFVHRLVAKEVSKFDENHNTIHHKDFDKFNNQPTNLEWVDFYEHKKMHKDIIIKWNKSEEKIKRVSKKNIERNSVQNMSWYNSSELHNEHNKIRSKSMIELWNNEEKKKDLKKSMTIQFNKKCFEIACEEIKKYTYFINAENFILSLKDTEFYTELIKENKNSKRDLNKVFHKTKLREMLRLNNVDSYNDFLKTYNPSLFQLKKEKYKKQRVEWNKKNIIQNEISGKFEYKNHKVSKVEFIETDGEDVYCMTVVGLNGEHDRHNFACLSLTNDFTPRYGNGVFVKNTYEEDYFIPVRGEKSSKVETLQGAANLNDIMDIEYLQNKLFAAIKVPKAYLNYAEKMEGGSTLAQTDLRFARTVNRIQEMVLIELRRVANIHLFLLGFQDDMDNFDLKLTNPSTQQELLKLEVMKARLEVFKEMFSSEATSPASYTWAMQNILGFSESEIKLILRQKKVEKKMFAEIEEAAENYTKTGLFKDIDEKFAKKNEVDGGETASAEGGETPTVGETESPEAPETPMGGEEESPELPTGGETPEGGETLSENVLLSENRKLFAKTKSLLDNLDRKFKDLDKDNNKES